MFNSAKLRRKLFSILSLFSFTFNIFQPALIALTQIPVAAAEEEVAATPLPTPTLSPTPAPSVEPTTDPSPSPDIILSPSSSPSLSPEPTIEPSVAPDPSPTNTPAPSDSAPAPPEVTSTPAPDPNMPSPTPTPNESLVPTIIPDPVSGELQAQIIDHTIATSIDEFDLTINEEGSATLATDKLDYAPTDTALITGAGFEPGDSYSLTISSSDDPATSTTVSVTADESGKIFYAYQLDGTYRPNYKVEAKDITGRLVATTTFTDSRNFSSVTINGASTVNVSPSDSLSVIVTIWTNGSQEGNDWESTRYTIEGQPSVCDNSPSIYSDSSNTSSTFNLIAPPTPGQYDLTVTAFIDNSCTNQNNTFTRTNAITVVSSTPQPSWPTSWTTPNSCISDPVNDESPSSTDLIGSTITPAVGFTTDANHAFFRERVDGNPAGSGTFDQFAWVVLFQTSGAQYQYLGSVDGVAEKVKLFANSSPAGIVDFNPLLNDPAEEPPLWEGSTATYARITTGVDGKKYVEWAIPITELTSRGITNSTTKYFATSANANNFNKDHLQCYEQFADLSITKSDSPDPVLNGGTLTYTLTVNNAGPDTASSVLVTDTLPTGFSPTSVTPTVGSCSDTSAPSIQCELGDMINGASATITIVGTVSTASSTITNTASVSLDTTKSLDRNLTNNTDTEDTTITKLGTFIIEKQTIPDGSTETFSFSGNAGGTISDDGQIISANVPAGIYTATENAKTGWDLTSISCNDANSTTDLSTSTAYFNVEAGETVKCTFTNSAQPSTLIVKKVIVGGTKTASDFSFSVNNTPTIAFEDDGENQVVINAGTYSVTEPTDSDYATSYDNCSGTISFGENKTCTITNTRKTGKLFIDKILFNNEGPGQPSDWTFMIDGIFGSWTNGQSVELNTGTYTITESTNIEGYSVMSVGGACSNLVGNSATVTVGIDDQHCIFTNARDKGSALIHKRIDINGDGDWNDANENSDSYANSNGFSWELDGAPRAYGSTITDLATTLSNYYHTFSEYMPTNYHFVSWYNSRETGRSCTNPNGTTLPSRLTITKDQTTEITLCNQKDVGSIRIVKAVPGNNNQDFTFSGNNGLGNFTLDDDGNNNNTRSSYKQYSLLSPNSYTVSETNIPNGWVLDNVVCTGDTNYQVSNQAVTIDLDNGENVVCTFSNREPKGTVTVIKHAINSSDQNFSFHTNLPGVGGHFELEDDGFDHNGGTEESKTWTVPVGTYFVSEDHESGWKLSDLGCESNAQWGVREDGRSLTFDVTDGGSVTCTFTNTKLGKINGQKYHDKNADGSRDWFEFGIPNWSIYIEQNGLPGYQSGEPITQTSNNQWSYGWYQFDNLMPGDYKVCELMQEDWYNSTPLCQTTHLTPGDIDTLYFGNYHKGSITITKDVVTYEGKSVNDESGTEFTFHLSGLDTTPVLGDGESETITGVMPGTYNLTEEENPAYEFAGCYLVGPHHEHEWDQDEDRRYHHEHSDDSRITIESGENVSLVCKNKQKTGDLTVTKYNDLDGDGVHDENEPTLSDWEINLTDHASQLTSDLGLVTFEHLLTGSYQLSETLQTDWAQTSISCSTDQSEESEPEIPNLLKLISFSEDSEDKEETSNSHEVQINPGATTYCEIGNQAEPVLRIQKTNDATGNKNPGDIITYTLTLDLAGSDLSDVTVTDVTPQGFTYVAGSYTSSQPGVSEPNYGSPGTWNIGDMLAGDTITLTYQAKIGSDQDGGTYSDIAWGQGSSSAWGTVLAQGHDSTYLDSLYVGTDVTIVKNMDQTGSVNIERTGEVLGASTELPATGSNTGWLILAIGLLLLGLALIFGGKMKVILVVLFSLSPFLMSRPLIVHAADPDNQLSVRIEQPQTPTRSNDWKLGFSVLDRSFGTPIVTCYVKKPSSGSYVSFGATHTSAKPEGDNGSCLVDSSVVSEQGTYSFYVTAVSGELSENSATVTVLYDTEGPDRPVYYHKENIGYCHNKISFRSADDGGRTSSIQIFGSTNTTFNTDAGTRLGSVTLGSNQEGSFTHNQVGEDCNKTWYYVIRAYDSVGNSSAHLGDEIVTITTITPSAPTFGAIPVTTGAGSVLGQEASATATNTATPAPEQTSNVEGSGLVAGIKDVVNTATSNPKIWYYLAGVVLLILGIYVYSRRR